MSDRIFGIIIVALAAFYAWGTSLIPDSFIQDPVGPRLFPYGLAVLGAICGIFIILKPDAEPAWPARSGIYEVFASILVLFSYAYLLPVFGFILATILGSAYFSWRFGAELIYALLIGIGISLSIYTIFSLLLGLTLASGPFGF